MTTNFTAQHELASQVNRVSSRRLMSLDVFRGVTIALMILVTDPGTYSHVYPELLHAQWTGATATDMVFPSFLFIVGVALTLSVQSKLHTGVDKHRLLLSALRRSLLLFVLGLVLNGFPDYKFASIRIPGILQRIAACYLTAFGIYLATIGLLPGSTERDRMRRIYLLACAAAALLALYWTVLKLVPVPGFGVGRLDSLGSLPAAVDRAVFGIRHLWPWGLTPGVGVTFDPEGILSTVPAVATTLTGVAVGEWMLSPSRPAVKASRILLSGIFLFVLGVALSPAMPIIKKIWTPTFALLSGGLAAVTFAALYYVVDVRRSQAWTPPARIFGMNAILAFTASTVITVLLDRIHVAGDPHVTTLHEWLYFHGFASWLPPIDASLGYALLIVLLNLALLYPLYRRGIVVRL